MLTIASSASEVLNRVLFSIDCEKSKKKCKIAKNGNKCEIFIKKT